MIGSSSEADKPSIDTTGIREWRAIVTLIVFVLTNINVLWPWHIPIPIPVSWRKATNRLSIRLRITAPPSNEPLPIIAVEEATLEKGSGSGPGSPTAPALKPGDGDASPASSNDKLTSPALTGKCKGDGSENRGAMQNAPEDTPKPPSKFETFKFPMNFVTAPIIADLFLLAIGAIGAKEVRQGTLGANGISPLDIMLFFITLAYIAISIDASGLIRFLAFKVLQKGQSNGRRLFLYLYAFFFSMTTCIGNDPVILSGTAFLAYMTRVSKAMPPQAWIFSQFATANIGSAILVSSNPTNLVLAGAFQIKFIHYTANMVVPTIVTAIVLFPFLLYVVFRGPKLIPSTIEMYELPQNLQRLRPINPNLPNPRGKKASSPASECDETEEKLLTLEEVLNPFLDRTSAIVGSVVMATTLAAVLGLNAASTTTGEHPVFWVTLPAAFLMFCWDVGFGWFHRKDALQTAEEGAEQRRLAFAQQPAVVGEISQQGDAVCPADERRCSEEISATTGATSSEPGKLSHSSGELFTEKKTWSESHVSSRPPATLVGSYQELVQYLRKTFPTTMAVFSHLPLALVPFAFAMFILVQALVSKSWVATFAYGWKHWVDKTDVVGGVAGMGFLSVILCNFAGTNIGTTILLSRVIQAWEEIHLANGSQIEDRTFWATVYSMAIGVNFGAFSSAFSASLAGLLWRNILDRKKITVGSLEFARTNLPIISVAMIVGLTVLLIQVHITKDGTVH